MLNKLMDIFATPNHTPQDTPEDGFKLATCVVLLEAARIDDEFTDDERTHIVETMKKRFDLEEEDVHELIEAATDHREQSIDLWKYTHQINETCTLEEKQAMIEEMWRVIMVDGGMHGNETSLIRQIARLLNLTHTHLIEAKVKVLEEFRSA